MNLPDPAQDDAHLDETPTVVLRTATRPLEPPAARTGWLHYLVALNGPEQGRRVMLGAAPLRIGRRPPAELVLKDAQVSGLHCQLQCAQDQASVTVADLGSTNGTFVDDQRVVGSAQLANGALLQVGSQLFRHEFRPPGEAARSQELERDLDMAGRYLRSLLPPAGRLGPIQVDWVFEPSARLGGDAFGQVELGDGLFAGFLIDVSGHGVAAALHTAAVLNVLRQRALPDTDFSDPAQVLARLNAMFPMERHGGLFFTLWYGVHDLRTRQLRYASAGHHPAFLVDAERRQALPLRTKNPMIGALPPDARFAADSVPVPAGAMLHVFSDGLFEIEAQGRNWRLADFVPLLLDPALPGLTEPQRLLAAVRAVHPTPFDDDVSLLTVTFLS